MTQGEKLVRRIDVSAAAHRPAHEMIALAALFSHPRIKSGRRG